MGIKRLSDVPGVTPHVINLSGFSNQVFAIDASITIMASLFAQKGRHLTHGGRITTHLNTMLNTISMLAKKEIQTIWVFDPTHHTRHKRYDAHRERSLSILRSSIGANTLGSLFDDAKSLLRYLGIQYVDLSEYPNIGIEAEQFCAYLTRHGIADAVWTNDLDTLAFGATNVITWDNSGSRKRYLHYNLNQILHDLGITYHQFVKMSVMLGTDFNTGTKGIGPKSVLQNLDMALTKSQITALGVFMTPDTDMDRVTTHQPQRRDEDVIWFLCDQRGFNNQRVQRILQSI